jgi:flagellar motor switch protein FliN/FliY
MSTPDPKTAAVARAQFGNLSPNAGGAAGQEMNLNLILDVAVTLALEVGRARMSVRDLLQLTPGAVVELDRLAGEPLDVLVNGVRVARGEVVVVNEKFGIRLTEVVSATERMEHARRRGWRNPPRRCPWAAWRSSP